MKILDHYSLFFETVNQEFVNEDTLGNPELLGQFGPIKQVRVLQESNPVQIYVRFVERVSAVEAIKFCKERPDLFKDAKHGYQKYCIKFINKQKCRRQGCPNRHSYDLWDIILHHIDIVSFIFLCAYCVWEASGLLHGHTTWSYHMVIPRGHLYTISVVAIVLIGVSINHKLQRTNGIDHITILILCSLGRDEGYFDLCGYPIIGRPVENQLSCYLVNL